MNTDGHEFSHVILWMSSGAWPLQSQIIAADEVRCEEGRLILMRDDRPAFQARSSDVAQIELHSSLQAAQRAFDERRAVRGRGGLRIEELSLSKTAGASGASTTLARGGPAEGIGFRVNEDR